MSIWIILPALPWPWLERWTTFHSFLGLQTQSHPVLWSVFLLPQWPRNSKVLQTSKGLLHPCLCLCSEVRNYVSSMIRTMKLFLGQTLPFTWFCWHFLSMSSDCSISSFSCFRTMRTLTSCKLHYKLQDFSVSRDLCCCFCWYLWVFVCCFFLELE